MIERRMIPGTAFYIAEDGSVVDEIGRDVPTRTNAHGKPVVSVKMRGGRWTTKTVERVLHNVWGKPLARNHKGGRAPGHVAHTLTEVPHTPWWEIRIEGLPAHCAEVNPMGHDDLATVVVTKT